MRRGSTRFDSGAIGSTPRLTLWPGWLSFDAVMLAAQQISHSRKGDDSGRSASSFLQWISDESALQMAMLAVASDQVLLLVRQHDVDVPDPAQCSSFV